jgi:hypothetical protein
VLEAQVIVEGAEFTNDNPFSPGSLEYNMWDPKSGKAAVLDFTLRPQFVVLPAWHERAPKDNKAARAVVGKLQNIISGALRTSGPPLDGSAKGL